MYNLLHGRSHGIKPGGIHTQLTDEHAAYADVHAKLFIGIDKYFDILDSHVESGDPPLVITGESGTGKSALVANWASKYRETHPDANPIIHFIGATPFSADSANMLRRIMAELKDRFEIPKEIPNKPDRLQKNFKRWLYMAAAKDRFVLILDGLDQLESPEGAPDFKWLPPVVPENVRLILTTTADVMPDVIKEREWHSVEIKPTDSDESVRFSKGAYDKILERLENDFENDRPDLVRDFTTLLNAACRGLTETELRELTGSDDKPLPDAIWTRFIKSADSFLFKTGDLINISHRSMRDAVRDRYLKDENEERELEKQIAPHIRIADYFSEREFSKRVLDELPWQLVNAGSWQRLSDLLTDMEFFKAAWLEDEFEIKKYWRIIERSSDIRLVDSWKPVIENPKKAPDEDTIEFLSVLLADMGHPTEALSLYKWLTEHHRQSGNRIELASTLHARALILRELGDLDNAIAMHKECEGIFRELDDLQNYQRSAAGHAAILIKLGSPDEAMKLLSEREKICRFLDDRMSLADCLGARGSILIGSDELKRALELFAEQEKINREIGDPAELQRSLGNIAVIRWKLGMFDEALETYGEQERIARDLGYRSSLQNCLGNQALILWKLGKSDESLELLNEREKICRELDKTDGLLSCLTHKAMIFRERGDSDSAMDLLKEAEKTCRDEKDMRTLHRILGQQAQIVKDRGKLNEALKLWVDKERICRKLGDTACLIASYRNMALIYWKLSEYTEAMELFRQEERLCIKMGNLKSLQNCYGHQALLLKSQDDPDSALALHKKEENICRKQGYSVDLQRSLGNQGSILREKNNLEGALKLHRAEEAICRDIGLPYNLQQSLGNQGSILTGLDKLDDAMDCLREQEKICKKLDIKGKLAVCWVKQAYVLSKKELHQEALELAETAHDYAVEHDLKSVVRWIKPNLGYFRAFIG